MQAITLLLSMLTLLGFNQPCIEWPPHPHQQRGRKNICRKSVDSHNLPLDRLENFGRGDGERISLPFISTFFGRKLNCTVPLGSNIRLKPE